jgi:cytochrome P450
LNSIPATYLCLLHILSSPNILSSIRTELHIASFLSLAADQQSKLVPTGLPHLHALVREVLRYHSTAWSAREVTETTMLDLKSDNGRVYELQKGAIVACPSSLLHHDPSTHTNPGLFDAKRFLSKELGGMGTPVSSATLRPFGGGGSYCPGRLFAERQVMGCLAALVGRFDMEVIAKKWQIPRNADFFFVTKCEDVKLGVSKREGEESQRSAV